MLVLIQKESGLYFQIHHFKVTMHLKRVYILKVYKFCANVPVSTSRYTILKFLLLCTSEECTFLNISSVKMFLRRVNIGKVECYVFY